MWSVRMVECYSALKRKGCWHSPQHINLEDWVLSELAHPSPSLPRLQAFDPSALCCLAATWGRGQPQGAPSPPARSQGSLG